MHINLLVTIMIAALMWAGVPAVTVAPTEHRAQEISQAAVEQTPEEVKTITAEDAKAIALKHAGLTADQVKGLRAGFDRDDGRPEYEVEFRSGDWEYDYTIHAETGEILKHDKEYDPPEVKPTQPKPTEPVPQETKPAAPKTITAEDAKAIALKHAGLTADQVKGLRAEFERDDGRPEYEVEFRVGNWEYSYEIHGETGKILDWEKDYDD